MDAVTRGLQQTRLLKLPQDRESKRMEGWLLGSQAEQPTWLAGSNLAQAGALIFSHELIALVTGSHGVPGMDAAAEGLHQLSLADHGMPPEHQDHGGPDECGAYNDDDDDNHVSSPPSAGLGPPFFWCSARGQSSRSKCTRFQIAAAFVCGLVAQSKTVGLMGT